MLIDLLLARSSGVERRDLDEWIADRRRRHDALLPTPGLAEGCRGASVRHGATGTASPPSRVRTGRRGPPPSPPGPRRPRRQSPRAHPRRARHRLLRPGGGAGTSGCPATAPPGAQRPARPGAVGRPARPGRPDPVARRPARPGPGPARCGWWRTGCATGSATVGRYPRLDGWDRPRYLREHLAAVVAAVDAGVPVAGYWHWSLVDNYEWGSYEPRFGLLRRRPDRGGDGGRAGWRPTPWATTPPAPTADIIAGLRAGDRSVLPGRTDGDRPAGELGPPAQPAATARPGAASTCSAWSTIWATMLAAGISVWMAPTPWPVG